MYYYDWESDTCYACSGGTGRSRYHGNSRGYRATSPGDTIGGYIQAPSRVEALRIYKQRRGDP